MPTIGGNVCIRNGFELDYPFENCIRSLLPVCDVVSVCDGESTDGTQEYLREWAEKEPKLSLCVYPWPNPKGDPDFWVKWLNYGREHLKTDWHLQLDADEVLSDRSYDELREFVNHGDRSAIFTRWNFWRDHRSTIPDGHCCGKHVIRLAPQRLWMASDGPHPMGAQVADMRRPTNMEIFHYGFLRKPEQFFKKAKALQGFFFDTYDPRLKAVENDPNWMSVPGVTDFIDKLDYCGAEHPKLAHPWLNERGYAI